MQPTIIRQPIYGGTRVSLRAASGAEVDLGEIRAVPRQPGRWRLLDRNSRNLGTIAGCEADAEQLLIAATAI
jgi:hypothetical protein